MSEIRRRNKSEEPRGEESGENTPRRQTRVTLTKDVSSKYRKIMPKTQSEGKAGGRAPRRKSDEGGPAPSPRPPRAGRPKSEESGPYGFNRDRRPAGEGSRPPARTGRPRSAEPDRERRPAAGGRKTAAEGFRPPARAGRPRSAESASYGAGPDRRPTAGARRSGPTGPRRAAGGGPRPAGRRPAGSPAGSPKRPGPDVALQAIVNRELPETAKQVKETQELILNSANEMLALTEVLEGIHQRLEEALDGVLDEHGHLKQLLTPLRDETARAKSVVIGLYEKMSFQDLAGQRLLKVEDFLAALSRVLGGLGPKKPGPGTGSFKGSAKPAGKAAGARLKGPRAEGEGLGQNDIDQLLADL